VKINKYRQTNYERYISDITAVIPAGPVVAGSPSLWYSLGQRNNLLATVSILWAIDCNGLNGYEKNSVAEIMRRENVRFVVIDPYIRAILNSEKTESGRLFHNFIKSKCMLVKAFRNDGYIGLGECPEGEWTEVFTVISGDY
jgi:hypothetical protein